MPLGKDWLIENYLYGIDLTDDNGNPYPDSLFNHAIKSSIQRSKRVLDIELEPVTFLERHDFDLAQWQAWGWLKVRRKPVRSITSLSFFYGNQKLLDVPSSWIVEVVSESGQFQLMPVTGSIQSAGVHGIMPWVGLGSRHVPGFYEVEYEGGFAADDVPEDILHLIGLYASQFALNPAGDLIVGAGIASKSIGIDGLSEAVGTTSSATNAGYGARIIQYNKEIKALVPEIRNYYHGISMRVS